MKRYGLAILKHDYCGYNDRSKTMILPYEFDSVEDAQDKIVDIYLTARDKAPLVNQRLFKNKVRVQNHEEKQFDIFVIKNGQKDFKDITTDLIMERGNRATNSEWFEIARIS